MPLHSGKPDVDWGAAEVKLVREATARFRDIAVEYRAEEFYGVCFECDLVYTAVQAHMNTNAKLRAYAEGSAPLYPGRSIEQLMEELRWDVGGWGYFPIFPTPDFSDIAAAFQRIAAIMGGYEAEMFMKDDLLQMACRAVVRLERDRVFDALPRTTPFRVLCIYREPTIEPDEESERRLERVRRSLGRT